MQPNTTCIVQAIDYCILTRHLLMYIAPIRITKHVILLMRLALFFAKLPFRHRLPKREIAILFLFSAIVILFLNMKGKSNHTNVHLSCSYAACTVIASQDVIQLNLSCSGLQSETNVRSGNATEFFRFVIPVARRSTEAGACRRHWWSNAIAFYRLLSSFNTRDTHT